MFLTDELIAELKNGNVNIHNELYRPDLDYTDWKVGDLVLDRQDGAYGFIISISGDRCAVGEGFVVEVGVLLSRLIKLERI